MSRDRPDFEDGGGLRVLRLAELCADSANESSTLTTTTTAVIIYNNNNKHTRNVM